MMRILANWTKRFQAFLFPDEGDHWLSAFRIGLGLQVILYALSLKDDWSYLFAGSDQGLLGRAFSEALLSTDSPLAPRLSWLVTAGAWLGLPEMAVLSIAWWTLFCAGCGLLGGIFSRACAILAWFIHLCAAKSGGLVAYGVDNFTTIGLFYLMLAPLPGRFSLDGQWRRGRARDRHLAGFFRRVLQLHLCLIYFFGGFTKALGSGWWDGSNLWRALTRPPFDLIAPEILVRFAPIFPLAGIAICFLEIGYPFFVWLKSTRRAWFACILAMHVVIGAAMGMYLFALIMIVLNVAAFGPGFVWSEREDVDPAGSRPIGSEQLLT
jgi:hypothetical protein